GEDERPCCEHEPDRDHELLVDPIGEEAPREEREQHPDPDGAEDDARLAEREAVVRAERRSECWEPDGECGEARLRERPGRQDHPAVARAHSSFVFRISPASGPLFCGPATSSTAGKPCSRSFPRNTPSFSPRTPSPMFAWRSRFEPSGAALSFTWSARRPSSPIASSTSSRSVSSCAASVTSTPET